MPAYLIVEKIITDAAKFEEYRTKVEPMILKYGGRYLTKGGSHSPYWSRYHHKVDADRNA